jgi:hypothetical protein
MKNIRFLFAMLLVLGFLSPAELSAQRGMKWRGSGGWGMGSNYSRMYDPKTIETVNGEVVSVDAIVPMKGMSYGVHLMLKTDKDILSIHLGPSWYLENQDVKIELNDKLEIKGSRISLQGKPAIIAAEIRKGDEVLKLRDETGFPVWSGWRRP